MIIRKFYLIIVILTLLLGCSKSKSTEKAETSKALQTNQSSEDAFVPIPTPSSFNNTTITGYLLINKTGTPVPVKGVVLYLAKVIQNDKGTPMVAGYDRQSSIRTQTDDAGRFVFVNVPVAQYSLILDNFTSAYLLSKPDGGDLIITPKGGIIDDLGKLIYRDLPIS